MTNQVVISILLIVICMFFSVLTSGCTLLNSDQQENTQVSPTDTKPEATVQSSQSQSTSPFVSWKGYYPIFDNQTKQNLIEEAKDEIVRIFPNVDRLTLEGYWKDHDSIYSDLPNIGPQRIVFNNVDDTSDKYMEIQKTRWEGLEQNIHKNVVTIKVDPKIEDIVYYQNPYMEWPLEEEKRIISFEEAEEKALEFVKKVKGDDLFEENKEQFYIYKLDSDSITGSGLAYLTLFKTYGGVQYLNDQIYVQYDRIQDVIRTYRDELKDSELMKNLTTLSPTPNISEDEAKNILEAKLKENYPDEDLNIQYRVLNGHENSLNWYDKYNLVYADQPEPIRLIWYITFSDEEMRKKDSRMTTTTIIDAHTREIVSLNFRDIRIS